MSEKCLLDQWRDMAYDRSLSKDQLERFWNRYFLIEKEIYEQLLDDPDTELRGFRVHLILCVFQVSKESIYRLLQFLASNLSPVPYTFGVLQDNLPVFSLR